MWYTQSDVPLPLATKIYYSQRNNRLRSALCHLYYEAEATTKEFCSDTVKMKLSNENMYPTQVSSQDMLPTQMNNAVNNEVWMLSFSSFSSLLAYCYAIESSYLWCLQVLRPFKLGLVQEVSLFSFVDVVSLEVKWACPYAIQWHSLTVVAMFHLALELWALWLVPWVSFVYQMVPLRIKCVWFASIEY